jgi:uracil-DNA glycosylase
MTSDICDGFPLKPSGESIINCLNYLLEELDILNPDYIVLFGQKVTNYVLKSYGLVDNTKIGEFYKYNNMCFLPTVEENSFDKEELNKLSSIVEGIRINQF